MALLKINKTPSNRELRQFAGIWFPAFWALVGGILIHKFGLWNVAVPLWCVAGVVAIVGLIRPPFMRLIYVGMIYAVFPIGWVVSHVLLSALYYLFMTPIGLLMRLVGYDPMTRRFEPESKTYWIKRDTTRKPSTYFRQI